MKKMIVGKDGVINKGVMKGIEGRIVSFDNEKDIVLIRLDDITYISISSDYVDQPGGIS